MSNKQPYEASQRPFNNTEAMLQASPILVDAAYQVAEIETGVLHGSSKGASQSSSHSSNSGASKSGSRSSLYAGSSTGSSSSSSHSSNSSSHSSSRGVNNQTIDTRL
ncbi:MAG: hypothetical protein ABIA93_07370 [Candidatus Woesearchaeota archaeon]